MADQPKQKTKRQHTVPRLYLRNFADKSEGFFSFNKVYRHAKAASVRESAQEEYFYDFDPSTLQNPADDAQWVENTFARLEGRFKEVLDDFIAGARRGNVNHDQTSYLAQFIALQWLRTKGRRAAAMQISTEAMQAFVNQWYAENYPGLPPAKFCPDAGYEQALHADLMFDCDRVMMIAEGFWNLLWVIGHNGTEHPFYTSDEPVARRSNQPVNGAPGVGIFDVGVEYAYPLNSELVLLMFDRRMFQQLRPFERKTVEFSPEDVERYNSIQVMQSAQYVFCEKKDFELADRLCEQHPEIRNPDRDRMRVDSSPGKDGLGNITVTALE